MIAGVLDHLWQSTLFAAVAGLLTLLLVNNGAHLRYWLWFVVSLKFLVPFSLFSWIGAQFAPELQWVSASTQLATFTEQAAEPFSMATSALTKAAPELDLRPALWCVWALGFLTVMSIRLVRWSRVTAALAVAKPLRVSSPIPVLSTNSRLEPGLVGVWRPVLLMPEGIAEQLSPEEMATVVAHELCHLRRRDNLTAAIHMLVEALFWFYPPVWWLGSRLIEERERSCDEAVLSSGNEPQVYADGILKVCKFYLQLPVACTAGVSGGNLSNRMESIMSYKDMAPLSRPKKLLVAGFVASTILGPLAAGAATADASADLPKAATSIPTEEEVAQRRYEQARPRQQIAFEPEQFDQFVGYYHLSDYRVFTVTREGHRFFAELSGQPPAEIFPESERKFFLKVVPAQVSFLKGEHGATKALVLHQNGFEWTAPRISEQTAQQISHALAQRIEGNLPSPGTEQALRKLLDALAAGAPNYADLSPTLAAITREQASGLTRFLRQRGAVKSIQFRRVGPTGSDQYEVAFPANSFLWAVAPLTRDGKLSGVAVLPAS